MRSPSGIFDVACRSTASARSASSSPCPSSTTRMSRRPPASIVTSIDFAPASSAFSTNSLIAAAGRSITSPAAMRSMVKGSRRRIGMGAYGPRRILSHWRARGESVSLGRNESAVKGTTNDIRGRLLLWTSALRGRGQAAAQGAMPLSRMPVHQRRRAEHVHADGARGVPLRERRAQDLHAQRSRSAGDARILRELRHAPHDPAARICLW